MANSTRREGLSFQFETVGVHAGLSRSGNGVNNTPIYASTSFIFNNSAHGAAIFNGTAEAFAYSRIGNPTVDVFEKRMAALENGAAALAMSSGEAAVFVTITALAQTGSNIIVASNVSDSSAHQFRYRLPTFGISPRFAQSSQIGSLIDENTKGVFVDSISSTELLVSDIETLAAAAHEAGVPLIVDNTAGAGGFLYRPIDHGADIVVESTEWLSISGSNSAGVIIDSGKFDWFKNQARFPQFFEPSPGFHGLKLWSKFGNLSFIVFSRAAILRDIGPCLNPFEAFQLLAGIETLSVRVERNCSNALKLATWLESNERIGEVRYPGLASNPSHQLGRKYLKRGYGGLLAFRTKAGAELSEFVFEKFKFVSLGRSIGGSKTIVIEGEKCGETAARSIYVSVGLENIDDIITDFEQAMLV